MAVLISSAGYNLFRHDDETISIGSVFTAMVTAFDAPDPTIVIHLVGSVILLVPCNVESSSSSSVSPPVYIDITNFSF